MFLLQRSANATSPFTKVGRFLEADNGFQLPLGETRAPLVAAGVYLHRRRTNSQLVQF
jgi:hypothetical protein